VEAKISEILTSDMSPQRLAKNFALEMVYALIQIQGVRNFARDFILPDMNVTPAESDSPMISMLEHIGKAWESLDTKLLLEVSKVVVTRI
jgi:hypothetical protein